MPRLAEIPSHIASMMELREVVGAMRSLAGMRVQEAERALPAVRRYADEMSGAITAAVNMIPEARTAARGSSGRRAILLCMAEHGFVGGFNEHLIAAAQSGLGPQDQLLVLGTRGAAVATERGVRISWTEPMATRPANVPDTIRRLSTELYNRIAHGEIARIEAIYSLYRPGRPTTVERRTVVPIDLESFATHGPRRSEPLRNLPPAQLLERLTAEYVFALLTEVAVESLASENAARFSSMEAAHENVSKKLEDLRQTANRARQNEITTELLDVVTGAEALGGGQQPLRD